MIVKITRRIAAGCWPLPHYVRFAGSGTFAPDYKDEYRVSTVVPAHSRGASPRRNGPN